AEYPLGVLLGAMRPIVARRLLKDLTALGVDKISIVGADFSEPSYLESNLWKKGEYQRSLEEGAEQGGTTILPRVQLFSSLTDFLQDFPKRQIQLVLDPEANTTLLKVYSVLQPLSLSPSVWIGIGPERGWSKAELSMFEDAGFLACRMGRRVLRTEAAALIATGIIVAQWDTEQVY
ncbi:MAG: RsmE family RNA methyltransferase, partial [Spirochaetales bacterium]